MAMATGIPFVPDGVNGDPLSPQLRRAQRLLQDVTTDKGRKRNLTADRPGRSAEREKTNWNKR